MSLITLELRVSMTQAGWLLDMHAFQQCWASVSCVCPCGYSGAWQGGRTLLHVVPPGQGLCLVPFFTEVTEKDQSYPLFLRVHTTYLSVLGS